MDFYKSLIAFSLTNYAVFYVVSLIPGRYLAFGNTAASPQKAMVVTSALVALAVSLVGKAGETHKLKYSESTWMVIYFAVNAVTLYLLARTEISELIGVGVLGYWVAVVLGFVLNVAQYATWKTFLANK